MTFRGAFSAGNGSTVSATTFTGTWPAGTTAGDVAVLAVVSNFNGNTITTPSGWTVLSGPDDATSGCRTYLLGKVLASADVTAGSVSVTWASSNRGVLVGAVFTGDVSIGTPAHVSGATNTVTTVTTTTASSDVALFALESNPSATALTLAQGNDVAALTALPSGAQSTGAVGHLATTAPGSYGGGTVTGFASRATQQTYAVELVHGATTPTTGAFIWNGTQFVHHTPQLWVGGAWQAVDVDS